MFDKKKEETAAPEPSDLAAGIPSVAGKRSTGSKQSAFLLFAACVVVGFIGIAAWQFKGTLLGSDEAEVVPENDLNVYTSSKSLTAGTAQESGTEARAGSGRQRRTGGKAAAAYHPAAVAGATCCRGTAGATAKAGTNTRRASIRRPTYECEQ